MKPFTRLTAAAAPLPLASVDTDQLIPARFMKRSRAQGYGDHLLYDLRFNANGAPNLDFVLNTPRFAGAQVLVARRNFGAGSSREAAVYALVDFGFRCIIAPSFGDIFAANAVNNGLLPAHMPEDAVEALLGLLTETACDVTVDLDACLIRAANTEFPFAIDPVWRVKLLNGWDDLDLTASYADQIVQHADAQRKLRPWLQTPTLDGLTLRPE
jgi:3-isopropylmalate/(R)-2-methylmalate dehydratase small subunit